MKKNSIYLILAIISVIALTAFLGLSLKEYYKADATTSPEKPKYSIITLKDTGIDTLNYADIENQNSSFSVVNNGDRLVIEGFEGLPMDKDILFSFAHSLTQVKAPKVPSSKNAFDKYGIDEKATITAHYIDNSTLTFRFGNEQGNKVPCYIEETSEIYMFPSNFLMQRTFSPNDFVKKLITSAPETSEISSVSLSGECRPLAIEIEKQPSNNEEIHYHVTKPEYAVVSKMDLDSALGKVFNIEAMSAILLNPTPEDVKKYELDKPFSVIDISTDDFSFTLKTTKPKENGTVLMMRLDTPIIYKVNSKNLGWISAEYGDIVSNLFIPPQVKEMSSLSVVSGELSYVFDISSKDDNIDVSCSGKSIEPSLFEKYLKSITSIPPKEFVELDTETKPTLQIEISYKNDDRKPDKIAFIKDNQATYVSINGEIRYTTPPDKINKIITNSKSITEDKALI